MTQRNEKNSAIDRRALLQSAAVVAGAGMASSFTTPAAEAVPKTSASAEEPLIVAASSKPVVETTAGKVRGYSARGILTFKGIPYAGNTAGPDRFMSPAQVRPWTAVRSWSSHFPPPRAKSSSFTFAA